MKLVERRLFIDAPPARVYELLTDEALLIEWMAPVADLDASPGGAVTWTHLNGDSVIGAFVELLPARRIVFTYGWEREDVGIPPGIHDRGDRPAAEGRRHRSPTGSPWTRRAHG